MGWVDGAVDFVGGDLDEGEVVSACGLDEVFGAENVGFYKI